MTIVVKFLQVIMLISLISCRQSSSNKNNNLEHKAITIDKEIFTLYHKTGDIVRVARALSLNNDSFDLQLYNINTSTSEGIVQDFVSVQHYAKHQLEIKKAELQRDYTWTPLKSKDILFVQIQPNGLKNDLDFLDLRQATEDKIDETLDSQKLGEWIAGDLGPGGGNMLFEVNDIEKSLTVVLSLLQQNELEKNVVIGKRINIDNDDWFYEVIYPTKFSGIFNTM